MLPTFKNRQFALDNHFRQKIFLIVSISLILLLLVGFFAIKRNNHEYFHARIDADIQAASQLLANEVDEELKSLRDFQQLNVQLLEQQLSVDFSSSEALFREISKLYQRAQSSLSVTHLTLYDSDGKVLAAEGQWQLSLNEARTHLLKHVIRTSQPTESIETDIDSIPLMRSLMPVRAGGQIIGIIEIAKPLNDLLADLQRVLGHPFFLLTDDKDIDLTLLQQRIGQLYQFKPVLIKDWLFILGTQESMADSYELLQQDMHFYPAKDKAIEKHQNEYKAQMILLPLEEVEGHVHVYIGMLLDFRPFLAKLAEQENLTLIQGLAIVIFMMVVIYIILNHLHQVMMKLHDRTMQQSEQLSLQRQRHIQEIEFHLENLENVVADRTEELRQAHHDARQSEARYKRLVDNIGDGFSIFSFSPAGEVLYVTPGVKSMLGLDVEQVVGRNWADLVDWLPESKFDMENTIRDMMYENFESAVCELSYTNENGELKTLSVSMHIVTDSNHIVRCIEGISEDITAQRKMLQNLSRLRAEADFANHAKSRFVAEMSHELRTPMHAITNFTSLAARFTGDKRALDYLAKIKISSKRLTTLINDLLDLSKLEAGKMELSPQQVDLIRLSQQMAAALESLTEEKQVFIDYRYNATSFCEVDEQLMQQVMTNLLSNAIKHAPEQSVITIEQKLIEENRQRYLQFSVRDEGEGIPADRLESIFDEFVHSAKTSNFYKGTGLGLPIARKIIELHGGIIWAENYHHNDKRGAVFFFRVPQKRALPEKARVIDISA